MKLVMDFIPNHSSDQHYWFQASSNTSHEEHEKYKDYYVWVDGVNGSYPNNWVDLFLILLFAVLSGGQWSRSIQ